jgi:phage regulator Rha-like protein
MSKGDEFREKYYAAINKMLDNDSYRQQKNRKEAWLNEFSKANIKEIKEYLAPFATTLDQVKDRVIYDIGKEQSKRNNNSGHKL